MTLFTHVTLPGNDELDRLYKNYREAKNELSRYLSCETVEITKEAANGDDTTATPKKEVTTMSATNSCNKAAEILGKQLELLAEASARQVRNDELILFSHAMSEIAHEIALLPREAV